MPGGPYPGPPPQARAKTSPWVFVVAGVAAVLVLGAVVGSVVLSASAEPDGPVKADECVGVRFDLQQGKSSMQRVPAAERVDCGDATAKGKIVKVVGPSTGFSSSSPDCPDGADGVAAVRADEKAASATQVCVRNVDGPHPGDPGAGGAMFSVGDCVKSSIAFGSEVACTDKESYAKVVARVNDKAECPSTALEIMELRSFGGGETPRPVLCLGGEGQIVSVGECITDPSYSVGGLKTAACGSNSAVAKVLGRTRAKAECPSGTTHHLEAEDKEKALLPVMCVKKLRPTLNERIRGLAS
ncbi:hypothetical protein [Actinomadura sp. WAC 06369]|uniref:hypothetical protein n=1 Tax=Actinomadura sp. WAC 06369 TaxID=2203193 RepID=UPI0018F5FADD|nr:hypothetical protein [Actinomadura sp. WAC 06369]